MSKTPQPQEVLKKLTSFYISKHLRAYHLRYTSGFGPFKKKKNNTLYCFL